MTRSLLGAALLCAALQLGSTTPAASQGLASIAAVGAAAASTARPAAGCWGCESGGVYGSACSGGWVHGWWNCSGGFNGSGPCNVSSPGCGGGAAIPLDPDGATQYVSRGAAVGIETALVESGKQLRRNCEGVIVARHQTAENVATVRELTGTLSL